jgi:hypothetical protein
MSCAHLVARPVIDGGRRKRRGASSRWGTLPREFTSIGDPQASTRLVVRGIMVGDNMVLPATVRLHSHAAGPSRAVPVALELSITVWQASGLPRVWVPAGLAHRWDRPVAIIQRCDTVFVEASAVDEPSDSDESEGATAAELDAVRAWRATILGLLFPPFFLYSLYLALKLFNQPLSPSAQWRWYAALGISVGMATVWVAWLTAWWKAQLPI